MLIFRIFILRCRFRLPKCLIICFLHQWGNVLRQSDLIRQQAPGSQQQISTVDCKATGIQFSLRTKHQTAWRYCLGGSLPGVAMQATDSLQQQVHRAKIRNQKVKVQIQRLLQHLSSNHNDSLALLQCRMFTNMFQNILLMLQPVRGQISGVIHQYCRLRIDLF